MEADDTKPETAACHRMSGVRRCKPNSSVVTHRPIVVLPLPPPVSTQFLRRVNNGLAVASCQFYLPLPFFLTETHKKIKLDYPFC